MSAECDNLFWYNMHVFLDQKLDGIHTTIYGIPEE